MAIAAKLSAYETQAQVATRFADKFLEARLINAAGVTYTPGVTDDATFLGNEVTLGTGGYQRQVIKYELGDVATYGDDGVALATKSTIFSHDGTATTTTFTHVALVWSQANALTLGANTAAPTAGIDGTYTDLPIDVTNGSGVGLTVDLTIQNSGAASTDYIVTIKDSGYNYAASDTLSILDANLAAVGAIVGGAGNLTFSVATVSANTDAGQIFSVAQTTNQVQLVSGREAVFYWNLKQINTGAV